MGGIMRFIPAGFVAVAFLGFSIGILVEQRQAKAQQIIPDGQLTIAGMPVHCAGRPTVLDPSLADSGQTDGRFIRLNPYVLQQMPPFVQLFAYAHECGHIMTGMDEVRADAWAVCTGKQQGWFPPQAFQQMMYWFQNNPGDLAHPPGIPRVQMMIQAYQHC